MFKKTWPIILFALICISKFYFISGIENTFTWENAISCSANKFKCSNGHCVNRTLLCDGYMDCWNAKDETLEVCQNKTCSPDKFRCSSGACVDRYKLCDKVYDCIFGHDDEKTELCRNTTCSVDQFKCSIGTCIHKHKLCDGNNDCVWGEDEMFSTCHNNTCPEDKFRCSTGACIDRDKLCDGFRNCADMDDEAYELCQNNTCSEEEFRCSTGSCLVARKVCDGAQNCRRGEDESFATCKNTLCPTSQFQCSTGACISILYLCDGAVNCIGGDDESYTTCQNNSCPIDKFRCPSGACIYKNQLCDGFKNCIGGDDESYVLCHNNTCSSEEFRCSTGACIDNKLLCDGIEHCIFGGEDETSEICQFNGCSSDKFRCSTGACIDKYMLCDGIKDCVFDGDDETMAACKDNICPPNKFRCSTGACIDKEKLCDGTEDCIFGGDDEGAEVCKNKIQPVNSTCIVPAPTPDKNFIIECPYNATKCSKEAGSKVPVFTQLTFDCKAGYEYRDGNTSVSSCYKGLWKPPISKCYKTCPPVEGKNVDMTCYRRVRGAQIACNSSMPEGAVIYPRCKYQCHKEVEVDYQYIQCLPNGQWNRKLFKCIADCGKVQGNITGLIHGGRPENQGDSPWHVAIYWLTPDGPKLICGGTIISPQIIVSAANCFFNFDEEKLYDTSSFEIAVAKYSRDYETKDNSQTKIYKIKQIFIPDELIEFTGDLTSFAGDIALLWTQKRLVFSRAVSPACIDWTDASRFVVSNTTKGKLVGWGETEDQKPSSILLSALLPYISHSNCRRMVSEEFSNSIATDKFCAGTIDGAGARSSDSGGGLLFHDTKSDEGLYYLRGVVSNKDPTTGEGQTSIAAFTDVAQYVKWIYEKRVQIENKELLSDTEVGLKT